MAYCQYNSTLGLPGQGFHTHIFGIAFMDVWGTLLLICYSPKYLNRLFSLFLGKSTTFWNFKNGTVLYVILLTFLHWTFCIDTSWSSRILKWLLENVTNGIVDFSRLCFPIKMPYFGVRNLQKSIVKNLLIARVKYKLTNDTI